MKQTLGVEIEAEGVPLLDLLRQQNKAFVKC